MAELNLGKIGVLMGGPSSERDVSLKSGKAVFEALKGAGVDTVEVDIKTDSVAENTALIKTLRLSCAFIALHGHFGEDGGIQEILESLKIPFTGSGSRASSLAMDKVASRRIFCDGGLNVPDSLVLEKSSFKTGWAYDGSLGLPLVVKPSSNGSSIGLSIVDKKEDTERAVAGAFKFDERVVLERYIPGRELTVGILDEEPLPVIEIIPKNRFFDFQAKYQSHDTQYIVPAQIPDEAAEKAGRAALSAHRLLGCFGFSRVDMLMDAGGKLFVLELNSIPGFTPTSLLPKSAKVKGIDFVNLCVKLIQLAYERQQVGVSG